MTDAAAPSGVVGRARAIAPGLALSLTIAAAAGFVAEHYNAPLMPFALLLGMAFNHLCAQPTYAPGVDFAAKAVLRAGIVLLGARITFDQIGALGWPLIAIVVGLVALTVAAAFLIAPALGRGWRFALLTGGSVAICGASAALAISSVLPKNATLERNTLFTVVGVTTLSTVAMILYPPLFSALGLDDTQTGFLIGATIHDVAQVVGAGFSVSDTAGEVATVTKLLRVTLLPVVLIIIIAVLSASRPAEGKVTFPLFVLGFLALAGANSFGVLPPAAAEGLSDLSRGCLVIAIAALGVKTSLKAMGELGGRHIAVICLETVALLGLAIGALALFDPF